MDYEYEQDRHLRTLATQSKVAEGNALDAITELGRCQSQRKMLLISNFVTLVVVLILGMVSASGVF